jgi:2-polyprenyl-3-methyl-5-hydroxy-6-metoxy-1,4-benzoquinol methylase
MNTTKRIKNYNPKVNIIEKRLGISGDYQFKAIQSKNFLQSNWHKHKLLVINKFLKFNKHMAVLDLGTGSGNFEIHTYKKVNKIIGVDYNDLALDFLGNFLRKNKIKNVTLIQSDIRKINSLNLPRVDYIILTDVIEHLKFDDVRKLVQNTAQHLKPQGLVCVITPNYYSPWSLMEFLFDHALTFLLPKFGKCQHLSKFNPKKLKQVFEENGFKTNHLNSFNLFSWIIPPKFSSKVLDAELNSNIKFGNLLVGIFEVR